MKSPFIDANGILKVSAKDLDTGKEQSITITANDRMSEDEITQAMYDAQAYAGTDTLRVEALDVIQQANVLVRRVSQAYSDAKKTLDRTQKKQIKTDLASLEKLLGKIRVDKITQEDLDRLNAAKAQLEASAGFLLTE